jgi:4-hydroxybenzoyl-CoA reductase subunit alpha
MEKELNVVGARLPMMDAAQKAKGAALFTDDLILPGMLYGKILRSPLAHAKIVRIDTSKAEKLPGVKGVVTGQEIPDRQYGIVPMAKDEYALAKDKVRYIGDDVAAVCAIDPEIAEEALELIRVDYEELPAVFDPLDAQKEGAPEIHAGIKNNTSFAIKKEFGDVEKAFAECDAVFEDTFYSQPVNHAPLEPHAALAQFDPMNGELTIWSSTQIPFFLRRNLSSTLQIPESKVRVIKPKVGGGFGQKIDMFAKDFCAAWFAIHLGKPVKFLYDREEVFISTRQRHPMYITVKTGVKKDGTILAQKFQAHADGGAYNSTAPTMIALSCFFLMIPYRVPNLIYEGYHIYTNKPVGGAMRGHGIPQARFAVERQLDMIADRIGVDPAAIRIKNSIHAGEPHPAGFVINTCGFSDSVKKAADAIGWAQRCHWLGTKTRKAAAGPRRRPGRSLFSQRRQQYESHQLRRGGSNRSRRSGERAVGSRRYRTGRRNRDQSDRGRRTRCAVGRHSHHGSRHRYNPSGSRDLRQRGYRKGRECGPAGSHLGQAKAV